MTRDELLRTITPVLRDAAIDTYMLDAEIIAAHVIGCERYRLRVDGDIECTAADVKKIEGLIARRAAREPVAYITGTKEFYGFDFAVSRHVLIPRPETELLADLAIFHAQQNARALDLCTGSGCAAVAVVKNRPDIDMTASDISSDALAVAKKNARAHHAKIHFVESDLFDAFDKKQFDLIITNPPYVSPALKGSLAPELAYEPDMALYADDNGRAIITKIIESARTHLSNKGVLIMEIGSDMKEDVMQKSTNAGFTPSVLNDYAGLPRVLVLR